MLTSNRLMQYELPAKLQIVIVKQSLMIWESRGWQHVESPGHRFEHISFCAIDMQLYFSFNMDLFLIQPIAFYRH